MSALSAEHGTARFRSGPYLEQLLEPRRAKQRMAQRKLSDTASLEFFEEMSARIVEARKAKGWRTEDLAAAVGLGYKATYNMEHGVVSMHNVTRLAEALDVDARWLLHGVTSDQARLATLVEQLMRQTQDLRALLGDDQVSGTGQQAS